MKNNENNFQEGDENLLGGWITSEKAKQLLGIKSTTLYHLRTRKNGRRLLHTRVGKKIYYNLNDIKKFLDDNQKGGVN